jgi:hypothetical protein
MTSSPKAVLPRKPDKNSDRIIFLLSPLGSEVQVGVEGDVPARTDCATLARYVATVLNGLAVQATCGATERGLRLVAAMAMRAWPA